MQFLKVTLRTSKNSNVPSDSMVSNHIIQVLYSVLHYLNSYKQISKYITILSNSTCQVKTLLIVC